MNCTNTVEEHAQWSNTAVSLLTVNGACLSGFQGSVSRKCIQVGLVGNWSSISGSCKGTSSFLSFLLLNFLFFFEKLF